MENVDYEAEEALLQTAEQFYIDWHYHNIEHARDDVMPECMRLADLCEQNGTPVNRRVLFAAALLHDANYHEDSGHRFKTKEEYSKYIARHVLPWHGYDEDEVLQVESCIGTTERGSRALTLEEKILRRADILNVSQDRVRFLTSSVKFAIELAEDRGVDLTWRSFCAETQEVFGDYLHQEDLSLGEWDDYEPDGTLCFIHHARENVRKMLDETLPSLAALGHSSIRKLFERN